MTLSRKATEINGVNVLVASTSREVKGTIMPTVPDSVAYIMTSEPPGIKVVLCREWMVSPV